MYPSRDQNNLRVGVGYGTKGAEVFSHDAGAQKQMVAPKCAGLGGFSLRIIEALKEMPQFYYEELAQIDMPAWSQGTVVLAGDAAHCPSPFTGQGTNLALVSSFVLACGMARYPDESKRAWLAYERRTRRT